MADSEEPLRRLISRENDSLLLGAILIIISSERFELCVGRISGDGGDAAETAAPGGSGEYEKGSGKLAAFGEGRESGIGRTREERA